ncbi:MAG: twin-arginine translocase TatA/TatE family subunit [Bacteroidota bacterium]
MSGLPVLLFLDVSGGEMLLILVVVFLVFGPEKMPDMARKAGKLMNQMKKATNDLTREFKKETSVLEEEINAAHNKINEQVESVRREVNRTKAQVIANMDMDKKPETTAEILSKETSKDAPASVSSPPTPSTNSIKTE